MPELNKYPFGMTLNGMTPGLPGKDDRYSSGVTEEQKPESTQLNYTPKQAESLLKNYSKSGYKGIHQKNVTLDGQEGTYYLDYTNFTNTPSIPADINELTDTTNLLSGGASTPDFNSISVTIADETDPQSISDALNDLITQIQGLGV